MHLQPANEPSQKWEKLHLAFRKRLKQAAWQIFWPFVVSQTSPSLATTSSASCSFHALRLPHRRHYAKAQASWNWSQSRASAFVNRALMTVFSGEVGGLLIERVCNPLNRGREMQSWKLGPLSEFVLIDWFPPTDINVSSTQNEDALLPSGWPLWNHLPPFDTMWHLCPLLSHQLNLCALSLNLPFLFGLRLSLSVPV